jgi:hypothetical protein
LRGQEKIASTSSKKVRGAQKKERVFLPRCPSRQSQRFCICLEPDFLRGIIGPGPPMLESGRKEKAPQIWKDNLVDGRPKVSRSIPEALPFPEPTVYTLEADSANNLQHNGATRGNTGASSKLVALGANRSLIASGKRLLGGRTDPTATCRINPNLYPFSNHVFRHSTFRNLPQITLT